MAKTQKVLIISYGPFSGIRDSITSALQRRSDCEVINVEHSLRHLRVRPFYIILIVMSALFKYGTRFRLLLDKTTLAQWVRTRANRAILRSIDEVDAVISLSVADNPCGGDGPLSAVVTDHTNLLSKRADDYGLSFVERQTSAVFNEWERRAFASQDYLFPLSRYAANSMTSDYLVDNEKVLAIGAGPNLNVDAVRDGVRKDYSKRNILFVGLETERKGLPDLISAFRSVSSSYPDASLNVVGVCGKSGNGIYYHGKLTGEPLKRLFYDAQVFVMPSLREPFGIVFLEAMWAKAVCIGTNLFAMAEFIEDGVTGYLVNPRSPEQITSRLLTLFRDPAKMEAMANLAYTRACENWTWDIAVDQMVSSMFGNSIDHVSRAMSKKYANTTA
jgi:glycosyltransferase involved in cell wall biosynthesis